MSLDISSAVSSSASPPRTDHLLFSRQDDHHSSSSSHSSHLPSSSTTSPLRDQSHTPFTTTSASASSLLSSTSDSSSVYPASIYTSTSGLSTAASTVDTSFTSSPLRQDKDDQDDYEHNDEDSRRSSVADSHHPLPLALKTINYTDDDESEDDSSPTTSSHSHDTLRIAPRSPSLSLSTLPSSAFSSSPTFASSSSPSPNSKHSLHIAAGGYERRSQSLAFIQTPTAAAHPIPYSYNRASVAPLAPIRRKPLSSSARTSIAAASAASASARNSVRSSVSNVLHEEPLSVRESRELKEPLQLPALPPLPPLPQLRANLQPQISPQVEDSCFDLDSELEAEFSSLQFVTSVDDDDNNHEDEENEDDFQNPHQRFTRSGDLDSPTLYEFPKTAALFGPGAPAVHVPSSLSRAPSVAEESDVEAEVASDSNESELYQQHSRSQSQTSTVSEPFSLKEAITVPVPDTDTTDYSEAESEDQDDQSDHSVHSENSEYSDELEVYSLDLAVVAPLAPSSAVTETAPSQNAQNSTPATSQTAPVSIEDNAVTSVVDHSDHDSESDYPFDFTVEDVDEEHSAFDHYQGKDDRSEYSEPAADLYSEQEEQEHSHFDPADYFDQSESDYEEPADLVEPVEPLQTVVVSTAQPETETEDLEQESETKDEPPAPAPAPAFAPAPTSTPTHASAPVEAETKSETETFPLSSISRSRSSTMSLFTRKTSPPHLSLGSISNNSNPNIANANGSNTKDDNAQRAVSQTQTQKQPEASPNSRNSLYSVYDDDELKDKNIPIAPLSIVPVINTDLDNSSPSQQKPPASATTIDTANTGDSPSTLKPVAKSPSSFKLGTFFGWPSASPASTEFSDQGYSPLPSPSSPSSLQPPNTVFTNASSLSTPATTSSPQFHQQDSFPNHSNNHKTRNLLGIISPTKSNVSGDDSSFYYDDYLQTPPIITTSQVTPTALSSSHVAPPLSPTGLIEDMEDELKAISAELAGSIRREMDLEDLVDRLQAEVNNGSQLQSSNANKRTSDYFSDSGTSNNKFGDYDAAKEEIAQVQRRAEQEKAQLRLELTDKLTDERSRRRVLDQQIKELSERAAEIDVDALQRDNSDASGRVKQLESTCEDLRRRLAEERGVKENFEDLLSAMKTELQNAANERDNLRDEIVPQLRARVEGLETQSSEHARQIYETTKMQQELQSLKEENLDLRSAAAAAASAAASAAATIIADSEQTAAGLRLQATGGLSRSNTVNRGQMGGPPSSSSAAANTNESREQLAERLKDVEAQRDALHSALKSLLERQEFQNRENDKKIRVLEIERTRLLTASPKKAGYERDVATLRDEVSVLRRRAEEALEQKWQVEKGLGGLKMDLDRAEAEVTNLRAMLMQRDSEGGLDGLTSSAALETAYNDLANSYSELLGKATPDSGDEKTTLALQRLERALTATVSERDAARKEVAAAQARIAAASSSEKALMDSERSLSEQLDLSAGRVEELAQQVREQIRANSTLRERLSQMVTRGEAEQHVHKERITGLESRLRALEDQLVASQTAAEERVARHEDQVAALKDAHSTQLQRLRDASGGVRSVSPGGGRMSPLNSPRMLSQAQFGSLKSPMSPMFSVNGKLVPPFNAGPGSSRPSSRGSMVSFNGNGNTSAATAAAAAYAHSAAADQEQQAQVATLRARVSELEAALSTADREMQEVVGRMNTAQIEVMQLQEELEVANRESRRLQRQLEDEKVKGFEERFRMIGRSATAA